MADFPQPNEIEATLNGREIEPNLTVAMALDALLADRATVRRFTDSEDLGLYVYEHPGSAVAEFVARFEQVRNQLANELWSHQLFVSVEVLDELFFQAISAEEENPIQAVLQRLTDHVFSHATAIVFPLHSFGIHLDPFADRHMWLSRDDWGVAITSQSNDLGRTITTLETICAGFGLTNCVPTDLIEHWHRSRSAHWLETNPLLIAKVIAASGSYYGNEPLLMSRLQVITAFLAAICAFQGNATDAKAEILSSRSINNFQTLDIHHYMLLSSAGRGSNSAFVPISGVRSDVVEMSDLHVVIDPEYWNGADPRVDQFYYRAEDLYNGYLRYALDPDRDDSQASAYRKVFSSLALFKRSFTQDSWRATVSLATAFEQLLTHGETKKVIGRGKKRIKQLLKGEGESNRSALTFARLYEARCEILHQGRMSTKYDIVEARRTYVECFIALVPYLDRLDPHRGRPFLEVLDRG
jgi:hypothetical protein